MVNGSRGVLTARNHQNRDHSTARWPAPTACTHGQIQEEPHPLGPLARAGLPTGTPCPAAAPLSPPPSAPHDLHPLPPFPQHTNVPICPHMPPRMRTLSAPPALHALTMLGTTPSTATPASSTNSPKSRPNGAPWYRATAAPLSSAAYSSHGPIIQPRLVGQATTSPGRMPCCAQPSTAQRSGVRCVQGMALGSPCARARGGMRCRWSAGGASRLLHPPALHRTALGHEAHLSTAVGHQMHKQHRQAHISGTHTGQQSSATLPYMHLDRPVRPPPAALSCFTDPRQACPHRAPWCRMRTGCWWWRRLAPRAA